MKTKWLYLILLAIRNSTKLLLSRNCEQRGIAFHMIPMQGSAVSPETLQQFLDVIRNADGPVLGYCRTGTRSAILWQIASQAE